MDTPFYRKGLQFECQRCSRCCRIDPGYVFLTESDLSRLIQATGTTRDQFLNAYCRWVPVNGFLYLSLKETQDYDCVFWKHGGCSIYEHRPIQCKSYPFWESFLISEDHWESLKTSCPGVGVGSLHSPEEIEEWIRLRAQTPYIRVFHGKGGGR
ncbi:MAG: YkgJ family cysteine cluster protein [Spirochaetes bacterium]|nr:YkgJ family cysteine cluster protein [Spirochaetota bacterium]